MANGNTRREFLGLGGLAMAGAALGCRTIGAGPTQPSYAHETTWHRVPWRGDRPMRIVHLTDFHVGAATPRHVLTEAIGQTRSLAPDLVALTGDYLNHSLGRLEEARVLLQAVPRPCVATLGNHDHWAGAKEITRMLESQGIMVLGNQHTSVSVGGGRLCVVGIDDGYTHHDDLDRAFAGVAQPEQALILSHLPETAEAIARRGGRLVLAGHTHGGQVSVPVATWVGAKIAGARYLHGWYKLGQTRLYVSAGLGSSVLPFRVGSGTRPEVAVFDLMPAQEKA